MASHESLEPSPARDEPRWTGRRVRWFVLGGLIVVVLLAVGDGLWSSISIARSLHQARDELQMGADALKAGDVPGAADHFATGMKAADRAKSFSGHPAVGIGTLLPFIGDDVRAVRAVARASVFAARAGADVTKAARAVRWSASGLPAFEQAGHIDLDLVRRAAPFLAAADHAATTARDALDGIDSDGLIGPIRRPFVAARNTLVEQAGAVSAAADLSKLLPSFLGADGPRQYLVGFQNPSDLRGSGGFMGAYGILTADDGAMSLGPIGSLSDLKSARAVNGFPEVARRYGAFGGTTHYSAVNYSPDFPTSAGVLIQLWRNGGRGSLDGVIAVDPTWMSYVGNVLGPVTTPAWPVPLTGANIPTVLAHDTFLTSDQSISNDVQAALGDALLHALLDRPLPGRGFGDAMARAVQERHFQVYSAHPSEERILNDLGATGRVRLGGNPLFVVRNDAIDNRTGWFAHTSATYDIHLNGDGSADVSMSYSIRNEAPRHGPPSILIGFQPGEPQGVFASDVSVYLPKAVQGVDATVVGSPTASTREREFGHPVLTSYVQLNGGHTARIRVRYHVPAAAVKEDGSLLYRAALIPQPQLWPVPVTVTVSLPEGAHLDGAGGGLTDTGSQLTYTADDMTARTFWVSYSA